MRRNELPRVRGELPWVIHSWSEGAKNAPATRMLTWADYKVLDVPVIREALARPDTTVLVAADRE